MLTSHLIALDVFFGGLYAACAFAGIAALLLLRERSRDWFTAPRTFACFALVTALLGVGAPALYGSLTCSAALYARGREYVRTY